MWVHRSFYQRNILRKPGPLSAPPEKREENKKKRGKYGVDWSFRLIDFGRSQYVGGGPERSVASLDREHQDVQGWYRGYKELA